MKPQQESWEAGQETFDDFFHRMRPRLKQLLAKYRIPPQEAEDLLQGTLVKLLLRWDDIQHKEAWLISTLRFDCLVFRRSRHEELLQLLDVALLDALAEPCPPNQEMGILQELRRGYASMKARDKRLLWLRFGAGCNSREVSAILGCRPSSVRQLTLRALARLRKCLSRRRCRRSGRGETLHG